MADPQIYRLIDLTAAGANELYRARPSAAAHVAEGRYGDVLEGWTAQGALVRARLAQEVLAARLGLARGQALRELAASEFGATLPPNPQKAIGEATLTRTVTNANAGATNNFTAGLIPSGTKIHVPTDSSAVPPRARAEYETTEAVRAQRDDTSAPVPSAGSYVHTQAVSVPLRATSAGSHANMLPLPSSIASVASTLFDTFVVTILQAAGGSTGVADDQVRALAQACYLGASGPTTTAALAGALSNPRVRRAVYVRSPADAVDRVFIADESWAVSDKLRAETLQIMHDGGWIGFGARIKVESIRNILSRCALTVTLRDARFAEDTSELSGVVRGAVLRYFDDRPNFWTWTANSIAAAVAGCDPKRRILTADPSSVTMTDITGNPLGAPLATPDPQGVCVHYYLVGDAVQVDFELPV